MLSGSRVKLLGGHRGCLANHLDVRQWSLSCFALRKLFLSYLGIMMSCFAGIQSLFAFISLIYKIMILFCIGAGYIAHCVDGSFYFVTIKKKENWRKIWLNAFSCKQWGRRSLKNYQPCFVLIVDISHHPAFIATHINTSYTAECTTNCPNGCIWCCKYNKRTMPSTQGKWRTWQVARRPWRERGINKMLFWSNYFNIYHTTVCQW